MDLYERVKDRVATRDYRRYNLVEPVIEPSTMSLDDVRRKLFEGFRSFYSGKMKRYHRMPAWKQEFMKALMHLLGEHSYLRDQMKGIPHPVMDIADVTR